MINRTMQQAQFHRRMRARHLLALVLAVFVAACGGGDPEEEETVCVQNDARPGDSGREQASWRQICR